MSGLPILAPNQVVGNSSSATDCSAESKIIADLHVEAAIHVVTHEQDHAQLLQSDQLRTTNHITKRDRLVKLDSYLHISFVTLTH